MMLVGTNTVAVDDPLLTVRDEHDQPLPAPAAARGDGGARPRSRAAGSSTTTPRAVHLRTRDPEAALDELFARDRQHVFLEGGPTLAAAFLRAGLVDEVVAYVAPMLLGAGRSAVADLGITTIADAFRPRSTTSPSSTTTSRARLRLTLTPGEATDMFTGIVEELGTVEAVEDQGDAVRLTVRAAAVLEDAGLGDSIAVNGCCLTVAERTTATPGPPTSCGRRSTRPRCTASGPATGSTSSARSPPTSGSAGTSSRATSTASAASCAARPASTGRSSRSRCPTALARYLVDKGSITVDGVSLTVVEAGDDSSPSA